jgi:LmbE family N-acetylglucosaminyl deacetylase
MSRAALGTLLQKAAGRRMRQSLRRIAKALSIYDLPISRCDPGKGRVAVLAPHMDDEVLGCGGTIARHVTAGADVAVIFMTDGRHGGRVDMSPDDIVRVRKAEAHSAAKVLGVRAVTFLDAEDTQLHADPEVADRLRKILERERPEIVYLPSVLEHHPDHRAASRVLLSATRGTVLRFECRSYEVWTPLFPNCLVRVDETIHLKKEALNCYQSQLAIMDYMHSSIGLNAFRAMGLGSYSGRFAEAFHVLELADFRKLCDAVASRPYRF